MALAQGEVDDTNPARVYARLGSVRSRQLFWWLLFYFQAASGYDGGRGSEGCQMRRCARRCLNENKDCEEKECRLWIEYSEDCNCTLIAVHKNGSMTLEQVAKRLGYTPARIQQLEKRALQKISLRAAYLKDFLFSSWRRLLTNRLFIIEAFIILFRRL